VCPVSGSNRRVSCTILPPLSSTSTCRPRLMLDRLHHEAHGVDVLRLGAGAEFFARLADGDVHVRAHGTLVHVAVACADIAQDRAQLREIGARFGGRAHVGPRDDLHQRDAGAVQVHIAARRVLVVHQLARVLLDMDALDADGFHIRFRVLVVEADLDLPLAYDRVIELADLIALRQIGVEIVLAIKARPFVDLRVDRHAGADSLTYAFAVRHGQHAGHGGVDERNLRVRLRAESRRRAGEQLGVGGDLRMDLKADHDLPLAGCALYAID
jgi:hypothetical protein